MTGQTLLSFGPLIGLIASAAIIDFRTRRIPNWLVLAMALTGIIQSVAGHGTVGPLASTVGLIVGFAIMFPQYVLKGVYGGDVKLMAAIGAWVGPLAIFQIFVIQAVVGLIVALIQAGVQGRLTVLMRNSMMLLLNVVHVRELGLEHVSDTGKNSKSFERALPYAVPVLIATLLLLTFR
jgi:prepilin peptidase CpaA